MALQQGRLVKHVRTGTAQPAKYEGTEEPEGMADAPIERLLKDIVKRKNPRSLKSKPTNLSSRKKKLKKVSIKKKPYSPRPKLKPSTSGYKTPESQIIPPYLSPGAKKTLKRLRWKEGEDSPKGSGKGKKKLKKTKAEKLQEGFWDEFEFFRSG